MNREKDAHWVDKKMLTGSLVELVQVDLVKRYATKKAKRKRGEKLQ